MKIIATTTDEAKEISSFSTASGRITQTLTLSSFSVIAMGRFVDVLSRAFHSSSSLFRFLNTYMKIKVVTTVMMQTATNSQTNSGFLHQGRKIWSNTDPTAEVNNIMLKTTLNQIMEMTYRQTSWMTGL